MTLGTTERNLNYDVDNLSLGNKTKAHFLGYNNLEELNKDLANLNHESEEYSVLIDLKNHLETEQQKATETTINLKEFSFNTDEEVNALFEDLSYQNLDFYFKTNGRETTNQYLTELNKTKLINIEKNNNLVYGYCDGSNMALKDLTPDNEALFFGISARFKKILKKNENITKTKDKLKKLSLENGELEENGKKKILKQTTEFLNFINVQKKAIKELQFKNKVARNLIKPSIVGFC